MADFLESIRKNRDCHFSDAASILSGLVCVMEKVEMDALNNECNHPLIFMVRPCLMAVEERMERYQELNERIESNSSLSKGEVNNPFCTEKV